MLFKADQFQDRRRILRFWPPHFGALQTTQSPSQPKIQLSARSEFCNQCVCGRWQMWPEFPTAVPLKLKSQYMSIYQSMRLLETLFLWMSCKTLKLFQKISFVCVFDVVVFYTSAHDQKVMGFYLNLLISPLFSYRNCLLSLPSASTQWSKWCHSLGKCLPVLVCV